MKALKLDTKNTDLVNSKFHMETKVNQQTKVYKH